MTATNGYNHKHAAIVRSSTMKWVRLIDTKVLPKAQRKYNPRQAEGYAADFDLEKLGYPVVNLRDGTFWVIDGQHRIGALKLIGWGDQQIEMEVYEGLSDAEMAEMFLGRDNRTPIKTFDKFNIAITAERSEETNIANVVLAQGLRVSTNKSMGSIQAVAALRKVYQFGGGETLGRSLRIVRDAYSGDSAAFRNEMITGVGLVCHRYNGTMDDERLVARLSTLPGGVLGLLQKAEGQRRATGYPKADCVAAAIIEVVNSGRGGKKLESWWK